MPDKTRFEREIDEILEKSERDPEPDSPPPPKKRFEPFSPTVPKRRRPAKSRAIRISTGSVIVFGLVVITIGTFSPVAQLPLVVFGFTLVAINYVLWFRGRGGSFFGRTKGGRADGRGPGGGPDGNPADREPQVKYWRGRRIEEKPVSPNPRGPGGAADRGKIIEFRPPPGEEDPHDRNRDDE